MSCYNCNTCLTPVYTPPADCPCPDPVNVSQSINPCFQINWCTEGCEDSFDEKCMTFNGSQCKVDILVFEKYEDPLSIITIMPIFTNPGNLGWNVYINDALQGRYVSTQASFGFTSNGDLLKIKVEDCQKGCYAEVIYALSNNMGVEHCYKMIVNKWGSSQEISDTLMDVVSKYPSVGYTDFSTYWEFVLNTVFSYPVPYVHIIAHTFCVNGYSSPVCLNTNGDTGVYYWQEIPCGIP
jgi:hypothetical protein